MKIAYFDCSSGISGDMCLGALVDAGVSLQDIERRLSKIPIKGYMLTAKKVRRGGIAATKVDVILKRGKSDRHHETRRWKDISRIIRTSDLPEGIRKKGHEVFRSLFEAEARLRRHKDNPKFIALGERLEKLKEKHEQGLLHSLDFLKELLALAKQVVEAEKEVDPVDEQIKAKAALSELFAEIKGKDTPVVVERIVSDIDEIVKTVRFPGWQSTKAGEREVQKALRKVIYVKYKIKDQDLFDKAYGYLRQYY